MVPTEPLYSVRLVKQGLERNRFTWSIWLGERELKRSTDTFATLAEALLDAARASATLLFTDEPEVTTSQGRATAQLPPTEQEVEMLLSAGTEHR